MPEFPRLHRNDGSPPAFYSRGTIELIFFSRLSTTENVFHIRQMPAREIMRSVAVEIPAGDFSGTMRVIAEWLDANGYEPARYKYNHSEGAVIVIVDFSSAVAADAFAMRFGAVYQLVSQLASPHRRRRLTT